MKPMGTLTTTLTLAVNVIHVLRGTRCRRLQDRSERSGAPTPAVLGGAYLS